MKNRLSYLLTGIAMLLIFVQCKDPISRSADPNLQSSLKKPSLAAPEKNSEQSTSITLEWEEKKGLESFQIQLSMDKGFEATSIDSVIDSTAFSIKGLPHDTTFHWKVRRIVKEKEGPWSNTWSFSTVPKPAEPDPVLTGLESPKDGAEGRPTDVELRWQTVASASAYKLQVADDQNFETLVINEKVKGTSYQTSSLSNAEDYYWRVEPIVSEQETKWSDVFEFTTANEASNEITLSAPAPVAPDDEAGDVSLQPTFQWESVEDAESYILHVSYTDQMVVEKRVKGTRFIPDEALDPETTHYWRVRAAKDSDTGEWSEIEEFTTTSEDSESASNVTLNSPDDEATDQSLPVTLEWEALAQSNRYRVQVQLASNNSFSSSVIDETVEENSYEVSGLDNNQTYNWRVQAEDDGDPDNWSSVRSFSTSPENNTNDDEPNPAGDISGDRAALMELYEATGGDSWANSSGWGSGDPSNSWYGVEVNSAGRVIRLDLSGNGLRGNLPASIGNLTALEYLNVKQNALEGEIPSTIGDLENIVYLLLSGTEDEPPTNPQHNMHQGKSDNSGNTLSGRIPPEIGNLSTLEYLELSGSQISGRIPPEIGQATNLKFLALSWNPNLTGGIPPEIGNLKNLIWLYVRASHLDGTLPPELGQATALRTIHLGYNNEHGGEGLHGELPDLRGLTMLRNLNLDQNNLSGPWPDYWNGGTFGNLISLRAAWNNFQTDQLHGFENLRSLNVIALSGNDIGGTLPGSITQLSDAIIISLGWTNLSGELPQSGWNFHQLRLVYLNDNNLSGRIPASFFEAADNSDLRWLYLQNNNFTELAPEALGKLGKHHLEIIDISGNRLSYEDHIEPAINPLSSINFKFDRQRER